jgi:hypothetical protein
MKDYYNEFLKVLSERMGESINEFGNFNNRSSKRVDKIHNEIADSVEKLIKERNMRNPNKKLDITVVSKGSHNAEHVVAGWLGDKKCDVAFLDNRTNKVLGTIEFKWHESSLQKNIANNFANMIGETANIKGKQIKSFWIIVFDKCTPVISTNKTTNERYVSGFYDIENGGLDRYIKAYEKINESGPYIPDLISLNTLTTSWNTDVGLLKNTFKEERETDYYKQIKSEIENQTAKFELKSERYMSNEYEKYGLYINKYEEFLRRIVIEIEKVYWND